jgi:hypothetical protein
MVFIEQGRAVAPALFIFHIAYCLGRFRPLVFLYGNDLSILYLLRFLPLIESKFNGQTLLANPEPLNLGINGALGENFRFLQSPIIFFKLYYLLIIF